MKNKKEREMEEEWKRDVKEIVWHTKSEGETEKI